MASADCYNVAILLRLLFLFVLVCSLGFVVCFSFAVLAMIRKGWRRIRTLIHCMKIQHISINYNKQSLWHIAPIGHLCVHCVYSRPNTGTRRHIRMIIIGVIDLNRMYGLFACTPMLRPHWQFVIIYPWIASRTLSPCERCSSLLIRLCRLCAGPLISFDASGNTHINSSCNILALCRTRLYWTIYGALRISTVPFASNACPVVLWSLCLAS